MTLSSVSERTLGSHDTKPLFVSTVPRQLIVRLDEVALKQDRSRSFVIREALAQYVDVVAVDRGR